MNPYNVNYDYYSSDCIFIDKPKKGKKGKTLKCWENTSFYNRK